MKVRFIFSLMTMLAVMMFIMNGCGGGDAGGSTSDSSASSSSSSQDSRCVGDQQPDNGICFEGKFFEYGSVKLPPGNTVFPETGSVMARYDRDNSDDYIEITGTEVSGVPSAPITKIEGITGDIFFSAHYSNDKLVKYLYNDWRLDISYDINDTRSFTLQKRETELPTIVIRTTNQDGVDCNINRSEYEILFFETDLYVAVSYLSFVDKLKEDPGYIAATDKEKKDAIAFIPFVINELDEDFLAALELHSHLENILETYNDVCSGGCGDYKKLINKECVGYHSNYIPTQAEIDAVMANPVTTCPWVKPDIRLNRCVYYDPNDPMNEYAPLYEQIPHDDNGLEHGTKYQYRYDQSINKYIQYNHGLLHGLSIGLNDPYNDSRITDVTVLEYNLVRLTVNYNSDGTWSYYDSHHGSSILDDIGFNADDSLLYILRYVNEQAKFKADFENGKMIDCKLYENNQVSGSCME